MDTVKQGLYLQHKDMEVNYFCFCFPMENAVKHLSLTDLCFPGQVRRHLQIIIVPSKAHLPITAFHLAFWYTHCIQWAPCSFVIATHHTHWQSNMVKIPNLSSELSQRPSEKTQALWTYNTLQEYLLGLSSAPSW